MYMEKHHVIQEDSQAKYSRNWFVTSQHHITIPITILHQQQTRNPTHPIDSKVSTANNNSRKQVSDKIAKGLCRFCGEKWDRDHKQKCKV